MSVLLLAACGMAQVAGQVAKVNILLPPDLPSDKVEIRYVLYGPFGARGGSTGPNAGPRFVEIQPTVEGKSADRIRLFVWVPGCKIAIFEMATSEFPDVQQSFFCSPLSTVTLVGQISDASPLHQKPSEVRIDYIASWACRLFRLVDCLVPQVFLGTVQPDADGAFEIDLPDSPWIGFRLILTAAQNFNLFSVKSRLGIGSLFSIRNWRRCACLIGL